MLAEAHFQFRGSLHRLLVLAATEPDTAKLRRRVDDEPDLLREAMCLYVGLQQSEGTTAARLERICQIYDVPAPVFIQGLAVMVGAQGRCPSAPTSEAVRALSATPDASADLAPAFSAGPTLASSRSTAGRVRRLRWIGFVGVSLLAVALGVSLRFGGFGGLAVPQAPVTQSEVVAIEVPADLGPPAGSLIQAGDHWVKLAQTVREATAVDAAGPGAVPEADTSAVPAPTSGPGSVP